MIIVVLLAFSAFFSAMDTACSGANRIRLQTGAQAGDEKAREALELIEDFDRTIATVLIGNNIVNIASASIGTVICVRLFGDGLGPTLSTIIMTILVLVFGEVLPKCYSKRNAEKITMACAKALKVLKILFMPISWCLLGIQRMFNAGDTAPLPSVTSDELKVIIDEISEEGVLKEQESELVQSALAFSSTMAKEILTPRVDIFAIDLEDDPENIKQDIYGCSFSRIPVYTQTLDDIEGVIYKSEYFAKLAMDGVVDLKSLVRKVLYIPATLKISTLLRDLKREHIHMAIVFDEYGGTMGLVSLEDVLEELVGEIWDESDMEIHQIVRISDCLYQVKGDCDVSDIFEMLGMDVPDDIEAQTVGGWVLYELERIPFVGESFTYGEITVTVTRVEDNRIVDATIEVKREQ